MTVAAGARTAGPTSIVGLRLTVQGETWRVDVVVPPELTARQLIAELSGAEPPAQRLAGTTGELDLDAPLVEQGVRDGDLLVALPDGDTDVELSPAPGRRRRGSRPATAPRPVGNLGPAEIGLLACAVALTGLAAGLASLAGPGSRIGIAAAMALGAIATVVLPRRGLLRPGSEALAPLFAGAAVVAAIARDESGSDLLVVVAAGVVAAQAAVVARLLAAPVARPALLVWTWTGVVVAVTGAGVLAGDGSPRAVWAVLGLLAVAAARLLPRLVVDVPDEQLIDTEGMAATTWTVRGAPVARRVRIRAAEVGTSVEAGRRLLDAATLVASAIVAAAAVGLAVDPISGWERWPAYATGGLAGVALLLGSRMYAGGVPRLGLRAAGLVAVAAGAGGALSAASDVALLGVAGGCALLALPVAGGAIALGRGWRSVWWARIGDLVENLAVTALFPVALLAVGAFAHFRQMTS